MPLECMAAPPVLASAGLALFHLSWCARHSRHLLTAEPRERLGRGWPSILTACREPCGTGSPSRWSRAQDAVPAGACVEEERAAQGGGRPHPPEDAQRPDARGGVRDLALVVGISQNATCRFHRGCRAHRLVTNRRVGRTVDGQFANQHVTLLPHLDHARERDCGAMKIQGASWVHPQPCSARPSYLFNASWMARSSAETLSGVRRSPFTKKVGVPLTPSARPS